MADSSWIAEIETGRWYVWGPGPNGEIIRRYSDELDTTNSYQLNNDHLYGQYPSPSSAGQVYETALQSNPSSSLTSRQYAEVPRGPSSSADLPQYSGQGQYGVVIGSSSRPERPQRYFDSGGYNRDLKPGRRLASYQTETPSIRAPTEYTEPATFDPNSLSTGLSRLSVNELNSSPNFRLSPSPPQPQWTVTPSGRGRGSYQGRGKAPAAREPSQSRRIRGTAGETERLDSSYRMRNKDYKTFFVCGRVFKTLWTDAAGPEGASEASQFMSKAKFRVAHGEYVYSKIRRFVVVARHDRSCQCLPVTTYDGKGYRKRNIKLAEHGLIYTEDQAPEPVPGIIMEPLFIKDAVEKLEISYINYGRSYCVDTNVKVKEVGYLDGRSRRLLRQYYQDIHFPAEDTGPTSSSTSLREGDFLGMGGGLSLSQPSSSSSNYQQPGTQYDETYEDDILTGRPFSSTVDSQYEEPRYSPEQATSSRPASANTSSVSSSSRPPMVLYVLR